MDGSKLGEGELRGLYIVTLPFSMLQSEVLVVRSCKALCSWTMAHQALCHGLP